MPGETKVELGGIFWLQVGSADMVEVEFVEGGEAEDAFCHEAEEELLTRQQLIGEAEGGREPTPIPSLKGRVNRVMMERAGDEGEAGPLRLGSQALQEEGAVRMAGEGGEGAIEGVILQVGSIVEGKPTQGGIEDRGGGIGLALPVAGIGKTAARGAVLIVGGRPVVFGMSKQGPLTGEL